MLLKTVSGLDLRCALKYSKKSEILFRDFSLFENIKFKSKDVLCQICFQTRVSLYVTINQNSF